MKIQSNACLAYLCNRLTILVDCCPVLKETLHDDATFPGNSFMCDSSFNAVREKQNRREFLIDPNLI